jgi:hypothetical protein
MKNKKRSGFLGFLSAAGLAALSAIPSVGVPSPQAQKQETNISQQQNKQQAPVQAPTSSQAIDQLPTHMGGLALGGKSSNFGIAPKWYGENMVRRGTHKRTNKR